jgi:epsilon-lactone hydrolase
MSCIVAFTRVKARAGVSTLHEGQLSAAPKARFGDCVRVAGASLLFLLGAMLRRLLGVRRRPRWTFGLEVLVAAYRGSWSQMPKIGIVRWRNVGEALSPLQTDGLVARFVRIGSGSAVMDAAWLEPPEAEGMVLLYFHGGGFAFGSLRTHGALIGALARATRARTLAPEYRLAPEHPAPAAREDALCAYRYLLAQGIPARRIVLAGDSAGGTLVLSTLLALRDAGEPLPAAGVALSPWVDLGCSGASFRTNARFDFVGEEHCRLAAAAYLAGADPSRAEVSPLFAELAGLPPLLLHAGRAEVLFDQVVAFEARAKAAGVDVRLGAYDDMVHVWHMMRSGTPDAQRAIDEVGAFVREQGRSSARSAEATGSAG